MSRSDILKFFKSEEEYKEKRSKYYYDLTGTLNAAIINGLDDSYLDDLYKEVNNRHPDYHSYLFERFR